MADTLNLSRAKTRSVVVLATLVMLFVFVSLFLSRQRVVTLDLNKQLGGPPSEYMGHDLCPRTGKMKRSTTIQIDFRLASLGSIQNVFQTDTQNFGARLEIDEVGKSAVLIGRGGSNSFTVIPLSPQLKEGRKYTVIVELKSDGEAKVSLDGRFVGQNAYVVPLSCGHIALGYGFDSSRAIDGEATMKISSREESLLLPISQSARSILLMAAIISIVGLKHNPQRGREGVEVD